MRIIDVHAHLGMPQFEDDLADVLDRAARAGVSTVVCVGTDLQSSCRCIELARRFPQRIHASVGIHPNYCRQAGTDEMSQLQELAAAPEVVAIGETGLDFHREFTGPQEQIAAFRRHIRLALSAGKPLIVYSRKSDEEVLRVLAQESEIPSGVRHCFDSSAQMAARYVELGLHISFAGTVTHSGHKKLKTAARTVPAGRLLIETDCPYQTPAPRRRVRNEPAFIADTVRVLAELRGVTPDVLAAQTTANARRLFRLD